MSSRLAAALPLLAVLLCSAPAQAGDETSPADAYAAKIASLPAPTAAAGFRFDGVLRLGGKPLGHASLLAEPAGEGWHVSNQLVIKASARPAVDFAEAWLSRTLELQKGAVEKSREGASRITWVKTDKGFRATTSASDGSVTTEQVRNFEHAGSAMTTLAGIVLFARFAVPEKAAYATSVFEVDAAMKGEQALQPTALQVLGEQTLDGNQVLLVKGQKADQTIEMLFTPGDRELVGVRLQKGEQRVELLKADVWHQPARDPVAAANRAAYAFGTGEVDVLDDVILWPDFYEDALKTRTNDAKGEPPTLDEWRGKMLATWRERLTKRQPGMIEAGLQAIAQEVKPTKLEDGRVAVQYPESFQNLVLTVREAYGFWHLVALPTRAKPAEEKAPDEPAPKDDGEGK